MSRLTCWGLVAIGFAYLFTVGHRPILFLPSATLDEELFVRLAGQLASGHWLGPYNELTLTKGVGFPGFLALAYLLGIPANFALCLVYLAAVLYAVLVLRQFYRSEVVSVLMVAVLLCIPPLISFFTTPMDRNFFSASLSLALVFSILNLCVSRRLPRHPAAAAALTGILGAWFWVTREEGIWLLPSLLGLVALGMRGQHRDSLRGSLIALVLAASIAMTLVLGVGIANRLAYGRFVVNEITDAPFRHALEALERASYPDWRAYVPVPEAARMRIYAQSPTFDRLKPWLEHVGRDIDWRTSSCDVLPQSCGDFGGGWFLWAFRDAAARIGQHRDPNMAAAFYEAISQEVNGACAQGRLICARWMIPLVPPVTSAQIAEFPRRLLGTLETVAMIPPVPYWLPQAEPLRGLELQEAEILSAPPYSPGRLVALDGWYYRTGAAWFSVEGEQSTQIARLERQASPDLERTFHDALATRQRFSLTLACADEPCSVRVANADGASVEVPLDPGSLKPETTIEIGTARWHVDSVGFSPYTLRTRMQNRLLRTLPTLQHIYTALIVAGMAAFIIGLVISTVKRHFTLQQGLVACFIAAALSRVVLIALVDATSFPATEYAYLFPAIPFAVIGSLVAIVHLAQHLPAILPITAARGQRTAIPRPRGRDAEPPPATLDRIRVDEP